jgi:hypothetical protein
MNPEWALFDSPVILSSIFSGVEVSWGEVQESIVIGVMR